MTSGASVPRQLVTFACGPYVMGIDVLQVQEILRYQHMTAVPLAGSEVKGLINLRGHIVTAIGMRERLGLGCVEDETQLMNLVVSLKDGVASLLIDSVGEVVELEPERYRGCPSNLSAPLKELVAGVYQRESDLLIHIDPEKACSVQGECDCA